MPTSLTEHVTWSDQLEHHVSEVHSLDLFPGHHCVFNCAADVDAP